MRKVVQVFAAAVLLALGCDTAIAQNQAPLQPQTEWSDITEVVVRAHASGPAMWKLTRGESTVWVLGVMDIKPDPLDWRTGRFRRVLKGARVLIVPRESTWEPSNSTLPKTQRLKDVVSPEIYQRFNKRVMDEGFSITTYDTYKPVFAGARLMSDVIEEQGISSHLVPKSIFAMANEFGVPLQWLQRNDAPTMMTLYEKLDAAGNEACLGTYLDSVDYLLGDMPRVSTAWARGDLKTVMRLHREMAYTTCILSDKESAPLYPAYAVDNMVDAIDEALNQPGRSVAVWPLSDLLRKNGVLDGLRAKGVEITSPSH